MGGHGPLEVVRQLLGVSDVCEHRVGIDGDVDGLREIHGRDSTLRRMGDDHVYFRQLLAGRDFARDDVVAQQMVNFVYLIGDRETGEAIAVDPAYGVGELLEILAADGMRLTGVLATHYHPDHVGGDLMGWRIQGLAELFELDVPAKVHVQREEAFGVQRVTGAADSDLVLHSSGDVVRAGNVEITLIHTPGHTPGSQCFHVDGKLVSGDTLFLDGCGRTDLPGGDSEALYESLTQRLAAVPDDSVLYPGHLYSPDPSAPLGDVRARNWVFRMGRAAFEQ
jgi:glyoxylase-like metal-dependent hydrolase (beta-lactamase superfamily II)